MRDTDTIIRAISSLENGQYDYETADALRKVLGKHTSLQEKVQKYEEFLHSLNYAMVACNSERVRQLCKNAADWSYAHRAGNGEYTDEEQDEIVQRALERLTNTGD